MDIATIVSGDAGIAGVQWALQSRSMRAALHCALGALLVGPSSLERYRLRRAKFKPGRKLTAYYDLSVRDQQTKRLAIRPVAVRWQMPDTDESPPAEGSLDEIEAEAQNYGLAAPFSRLAVRVPAYGMQIEISPLDAQFRQLARLSYPPYVHDLLESVYVERHGGQTQPVFPLYQITPIRYRPGQRHVLRYDPLPADWPHGYAPVFAKLYPNDRGRQIFHVANEIAGWLATRNASATAIRPLAYLANDAAVLYPCLAGAPLSHHLRRDHRRGSDMLYQVGAALQALHSAPVSLVEPGLRDAHTEIAAITRACEHLRVLLPPTAAAIDELIFSARQQLDALPCESPTFIHGDFKAEHIWLTRDRLVVIDFDSCTSGDAALDVGKFLADLRWWFATLNQPGVEQAQARFLAGYAATGGSRARIERGRIYEALTLVKLTARRVRLFDRHWAARTVSLIQLAQARLQAVVAA